MGLRSRAGDMVRLVRARGDRVAAKRTAELEFWESRHTAEGVLSNDHYEHFYTEAMGLAATDYAGKRVLDIGCGPRGSLEWATGAAERVGLDPLVDEYRAMGIDQHAMTYVCAPSERIPFDDRWFDVVASFNSLDHVDDVDATIAEIKRVTRAGGLFLLITEVNHQPTVTEPLTLAWDVIGSFAPEFVIESERHLEHASEGVYQSVRAGVAYDDPADERPGLLVARLRRLD